MYMHIRALVYANSRLEAIATAEEDVFVVLTTGQHAPFDSYHVDSQAISADSAKGQGDIAESLILTKAALFRNLEEVRDGLRSLTNEGVYTAGGAGLRHSLYKAGQYQGSEIFLYDQDGEGIRNRKHLDNVLSKWVCNDNGKPNPYANVDIWVVSAKVHLRLPQSQSRMYARTKRVKQTGYQLVAVIPHGGGQGQRGRFPQITPA